jgi:nucleoside phosphorylase
MKSLSQRRFKMKHLCADPKNQRFVGNSLTYFAGRCLMDVIEYLRLNSRVPSQFKQLQDAHAIRLSAECLSNLGTAAELTRIKNHVRRTYEDILRSRSENPPHAGTDFWDWAYILEAYLSMRRYYPTLSNELSDHQTVLNAEARAYYRAVRRRIHGEHGLRLENVDEWFGPAVHVAAHRLLTQCGEFLHDREELLQTLARLKELALKPISADDEYLGVRVRPKYHYAWHYGQVVDEFPAAADSREQQEELFTDKSFKELTNDYEKAERTYAIARVIQGLRALTLYGDEQSRERARKRLDEAMDVLYGCQTSGRPLGEGIVGDTIKGTLNALEAVWPLVDSEGHNEIRAMLDALSQAHKAANTVGIVVSIAREEDECKQAFERAGARVSAQDGHVLIDHEDYRVLLRRGKATIDAAGAASWLLDRMKVRYVIMVGIAGSLGKVVLCDSRQSKAQTQDVSAKDKDSEKCMDKDNEKEPEECTAQDHEKDNDKCAESNNETCSEKNKPADVAEGEKLGTCKVALAVIGPKKGDVVVAAATAPYRIRDKVRVQITNARIPLGTTTWSILPADPFMFCLASQAARDVMIDEKLVHEGLLVSGTGIKDNANEKKLILQEWPGGLAVEEEGYAFSLASILRHKPHIVIKGISDLAGGDKIQQQAGGDEESDQRIAARNASETAVRVVRKLSKLWWN